MTLRPWLPVVSLCSLLLAAACGGEADINTSGAGAGAGGEAGAGGAAGRSGSSGQSGAGAGESGSSGHGEAAGAGGASGAAGSGGAEDKSAHCASIFGDEIGSVGFARFDGKAVAVVQPGNESCAFPNGSHVVVQLEIKGQVYRMVVNVFSTKGTESRIFTAETQAPLPGEPWAEGWHPASLDYAATLSIHSDAFTPQTKTPASQWVADAIQIDAPVSVFATAEGKPESAHLVHRNGKQHDGAIVVDPTGPSPRWLLFRFDEQSF